jgi:hypothetical protein
MAKYVTVEEKYAIRNEFRIVLNPFVLKLVLKMLTSSRNSAALNILCNMGDENCNRLLY